MSRKRDIEEMASLVGNSAAHAALYPGQEFIEREVGVYIKLASRVAAGRTWNAREVNEFREKALRRARSEIKRRIKGLTFHEKKFDDFLSAAGEYIDKFIRVELIRQ